MQTHKVQCSSKYLIAKNIKKNSTTSLWISSKTSNNIKYDSHEWAKTPINIKIKMKNIKTVIKKNLFISTKLKK